MTIPLADREKLESLYPNGYGVTAYLDAHGHIHARLTDKVHETPIQAFAREMPRPSSPPINRPRGRRQR